MHCTYCSSDRYPLERVYTCTECFALWQKKRDIRLTLCKIGVKLDQLEDLEREINGRSKRIHRTIKRLETKGASGNKNILKRYSI